MEYEVALLVRKEDVGVMVSDGKKRGRRRSYFLLRIGEFQNNKNDLSMETNCWKFHWMLLAAM